MSDTVDGVDCSPLSSTRCSFDESVNQLLQAYFRGYAFGSKCVAEHCTSSCHATQPLQASDFHLPDDSVNGSLMAEFVQQTLLSTPSPSTYTVGGSNDQESRLTDDQDKWGEILSHIMSTGDPEISVCSFVRGFVEAQSLQTGFLYRIMHLLPLWLPRDPSQRSLLVELFSFFPVKCRVDEQRCQLVYEPPNLVDFVYKLYHSCGSDLVYHKTQRPMLTQCLTFVTGVSNFDLPWLRVALLDPQAVIPTRARASDVGMDLSIIKVDKTFCNGDVVRFDTGVALQPAPGWYCRIIPRSSFSETGWVMVNSEAIIDPTYTGSCKVALRKVSQYAKDLPNMLPYRGFQVTMNPHIPWRVCLTSTAEFVQTERAEKGFGSSGKWTMTEDAPDQTSNKKKHRTAD